MPLKHVLFLLALSAALPAQTLSPALQCVANAAVPPIVRAEGITELTGDLTLNCTGGVPAQRNAPVPRANVQVFLNTNITSRILASGQWTEALLIVDEPHSTTNPGVNLTVCGDSGTNEAPNNPGSCVIFGTGSGTGVYAGTRSTAIDCGSFACEARPNVFQGRLAAPNSLVWAGVPFDPPGQGTRKVRITNVRSNASQLGTSATLVPTQITMFISITGSTAIPINNPTQTVAFIQPALNVKYENVPRTYLQCVSPSTPDSEILVKIDERFPTALKKKNISFREQYASAYPESGDQNQNVPGASYNTESGFENLDPTVDPKPNPPDQFVTTSIPTTPGFPNVRGLRGAGVANHGTRVGLVFSSVPNGAGIYVPSSVILVNQSTGLPTGIARLTVTDATGRGGFSTDSVYLNIENGKGMAVYEILYSDPLNPERMEVPVSISYYANPSNNLPEAGVKAQLAVTLAPFSAVGTASDSEPVPRFIQSQATQDLFQITLCHCNLLFPFVTSMSGWDTGIAVSNTSLDTRTEFPTIPELGKVTINYFCGQPGCSSPASQTTNLPISAGEQLTFTLSGGGNYGIAPTPQFQGYLIVQSRFQYCHGFAYLSALGAMPTTNAASLGYLGLVMHAPSLYRVELPGESIGH